MTTSGGHITNKSLEHIPPVYTGVAFKTKNGILRYCSREFSELVPLISELGRDWKSGSEQVETMRVCKEVKTMFAPSILLLKEDPYTHYTLLVGTADRSLLNIV